MCGSCCIRHHFALCTFVNTGTSTNGLGELSICDCHLLCLPKLLAFSLSSHEFWNHSVGCSDCHQQIESLPESNIIFLSFFFINLTTSETNMTQCAMNRSYKSREFQIHFLSQWKQNIQKNYFSWCWLDRIVPCCHFSGSWMSQGQETRQGLCPLS